MKVCSRCGRELDLSSFHKNSYSQDGYHNNCKECRKLHYKNNKPKYQDNSKKYYKDNLDKVKEYRKSYYEKNKSYYLYFIMENSNIVYVGSCLNKYRLHNHKNNLSSINTYTKLGTWTSIKVVELKDLNNIEELRFMEKVAIDKLQPKLNNNMPIQEFEDKSKQKKLSEYIYYLLDNLEEFTQDYIINK